MVYVFSKTMYRADIWAREHELEPDQYKLFTNPSQLAGVSFYPKDRIIVVGVLSQFMLNAIQAALGKPPGMPEIEFYP